MPLRPGIRLGPYELLAPLGAGGMGEVYRARDTRLDRTVAIKVLPEHLTGNPDLQRRFEREAKAISSLSHPHSCTLHDVGREDGAYFLVMEYLEGETLAARLTRGALPLAETLRYGIQIADALDKAHRGGVVHRDLKPGNVMLTKTGVKLLDFGLAKSTPRGTVADLSSMATMSQPLGAQSRGEPITAAGTIVGTFQYMAPEQLEGKEADARSDIFAFGAVLYEMATGKRAFEGQTQASLIAAIMKESPRPLAELAPMTPPALDRLARTCLAKDADERYQSMHDVLLELKWITEGGSQVGVPVVTAKRRQVERRITVAVVIATTLVAILALGALLLREPAPQPPALRTSLLPPEGRTFGTGQLALSPDGTKLAFRAWGGGGGSLWIQDLSTGIARELPGTPDAVNYFWSPDSKWLGFSARGKLQKVEAAGGPIITLVEQGATGYGTWNADGTILYEGQWTLHRVPATGGPITDVTLADAKDWRVQFPTFLPDGRHFLFYRAGSDQPGIYVGDLKTGKQRFVVSSSTALSRFAPPGWLFYMRGETLVAQPFDANKQATTGEPLPFQPGVGRWDVSPAGVLSYFPAQATVASELLWYTRDGKQLGRLDVPRRYTTVRLSPDGRQVASVVSDEAAKNSDIWVFEVTRGIATRITFDQSRKSSLTWSPDGKRIVFARDSTGHFDLHVKLASGLGQAEVLLASANNKSPTDWSRDGRNIVFTETSEGFAGPAVSLWDVGSGKNRELLGKSSGSDHNEMARISPDGKWLAYTVGVPGGSGAVGSAGLPHEILVVPFQSLSERWQVSRDGGEEPVWRPDGKELYWMSSDNKIMAASVIAKGNGLAFGTPVELFQSRAWISDFGGHYDVTPDGQRFLVISRVEAPHPSLTIVTNWPALLKKQ